MGYSTVLRKISLSTLVSGVRRLVSSREPRQRRTRYLVSL
jgi:hypothetical protein